MERAKKTNAIIVGRLDGTSYYNFSKDSFKNFLLLRGKKSFFSFFTNA